VFRS